MISLVLAISTPVCANRLDPKPKMDANEITWFGVLDNVIVTCSNAGWVQVLDYNTVRPSAMWCLDDYSYEEMLNLILVPKGSIRLFAHVKWLGPSVLGIRFYNLDTGVPTMDRRVRGDPWLMGVVFNKEGSQLYCIGNQTIFRIDEGTSKITQLPLDKLYPLSVCWIRAFPDENVFILCHDSHLIGKNWKGKPLWRMNFKGWGQSLDLGLVPSLPISPNGVFLVESENLKGPARIISVSLLDGRVLWERPISDSNGSTFRAMSYDGRKQAWFEKGKLWIRSIDPNSAVEVPQIDMLADVAFVGDGSTLVSLPTLTIVAEDKTANTVTLQRKSHVLSVLDTASGKTVKTVDLDDERFKAARKDTSAAASDANAK